jgi:hypothetical protein
MLVKEGVLKCDKSNDTNEEQSKNIDSILLTNVVLKLLISNDFSE